MKDAVSWDSQPIDDWAEQFAAGDTIVLNGMRTHYVAKGSGSPVILIPGFFFDSTLWCHNLEALSKSHRVYAIDLWGFGYSARTTQPSYALYSQQLAAFMNSLAIDKATLIGQSVGGGAAIQFSVDFPDKVDKLVLVDSAGLPNPEPLTARFFKLKNVGECLMNFPGNGLRKNMLRNFFLFRTEKVPPTLFRQLTWPHKISGTTASLLAFMRAGFADKLQKTLPQLAALHLPTLIIWGAQDKGIPLALGLRMHHALPGSTFFVIQDAGHVPNLEQPDAFNSRVTAFLNDDAHPVPTPLSVSACRGMS